MIYSILDTSSKIQIKPMISLTRTLDWIACKCCVAYWPTQDMLWILPQPHWVNTQQLLTWPAQKIYSPDLESKIHRMIPKSEITLQNRSTNWTAEINSVQYCMTLPLWFPLYNFFSSTYFRITYSLTATSRNLATSSMVEFHLRTKFPIQKWYYLTH